MARWAMAKKRKPAKFNKVSAVKALARERVGAPPSSRVVPDRKKKSAKKRKLALEDLLEDDGG
jgi:hypothetical protein